MNTVLRNFLSGVTKRKGVRRELLVNREETGPGFELLQFSVSASPAERVGRLPYIYRFPL